MRPDSRITAAPEDRARVETLAAGRPGGISLYTDGAALRNPSGPAGWAWHAIFPDGSRRQDVGSLTQASNNQAELTACIEGLNGLSPGRVRVFSDSQYVVNGMSGWVEGWQRRGWRLKNRRPVKNRELWEALLAAAERHEAVEWTWVRGHDNHPENERVNDLAESAAHGSVDS